MRSKIYLSLVHYPVYNKRQEELCVPLLQILIYTTFQELVNYTILKPIV